MVSLLRSLNNDLPKGNVLIFSIYSLVDKKYLLCKWFWKVKSEISVF